MIQNRRTFETTNSLVNYAFLVLVLLFMVYACTGYFSVKLDFIEFLSSVVNTFVWTMIVLCAVICFWALVLSALDKAFPWRIFIWNIFRAVLCIGMALAVNALNLLFSGPFEVTL